MTTQLVLWVVGVDGEGMFDRTFDLNCRLVSSVMRALVCRTGGRGFKPWPDQHSGSLNN